VAARQRRLILGVTERARVARAYVDGIIPDADGKVAGYSERHARHVLQDSMVRVAELPDDERDRLKRLPPPPAEGTQKRRAVELRAAGTPYAEIADELGVEVSTAAHYVAEGLARYLGEEVRCADTARRLHVERLRALLAAQWPKAMRGDATAATACLKIMEREAKLLGLDAPLKVDISARLRLLAEAEGLDPDELIAEARRIVKSLPK
jgi:hypothetical protein